MKSRPLLSVALALCSAGALVAQNAVTNGDFSSNAAAFTAFPGYVTGANPAEIDNWTRSTNGLGINGVGISTPFGPADQSAATYYGFIQNGFKTLSQELTLTPSTSYDISFLAASRNGNGAAVGRVLVADNSTTYYDSTITHWDTAAFELVSGGFATGAAFDGPVTITLSNDTVGGDNTVDYTNISITPASPPVVLTLSPADDATGVEAFADLVITFDKNVQKGAGNIEIKESVGDAIVESIDVTTGSVTVSGAQVTINPASNLAGNTGYYVQIDTGAIQDLAGSDYAGIGDTTTWNFTTSAVDPTAPTVTTLSPLDDAVEVAVNTDLVATFDEDVQKGAGNIEIRDAGGALVQTIDVTSGAVTISGGEVTINPPTNLSGLTSYYVQIAAGAIQDLSGNDYAGIADTTTWSFTTADVPPFSFVQITSDADSGIDAINTYTHAIDFGTNPPALVNGVQFVQEMGTAAGAIANTGVRVYGPNNHGGNGPPAVSGSIADVFRDMRFNGPDLGTVELTGLIPGAQYDLRFYDRAWDHNGTVRTVAFSYDIDSDSVVEFTSPTFDTNRPQDAPTSLGGNVSWATSYLYRAGANGSILVTVDINPAATYHIYGLTNQLIPGFLIDADPLEFASSVVQNDLISDLTGAFSGTAEATTFTFANGVGDADNDKFQISGQELQAGSHNFAGEADGTQFTVRLLGTGDVSGETDERTFTLTLSADSDADNLPDAWELANANDLSELSGLGGANFDGDTLTDLEEYQISISTYPGINPKLADTDGDNLEDGSEIAGAGSRPPTDPTNADTDGDGLNDDVETNTMIFNGPGDTGTDPTAADSDGDTVPDGVEVANGSDPNDQLDFLPAAITVTKLTDDASSGINPAKVYTHTISGGNAATVNGVNFEALTPTVTPANFDWTVSAAAKAQVLDNAGAWTPAAVGLSGTELEQLLDSFTYNGGGGSGVPGTSQTFTLNGLTVGETYQLRLYIRVWDTGGSGRPIDLSFTSGATVFDPMIGLPEDRPGTVLTNGNDQCAYYLSYTYVADGTDLVIDAEVSAGGLGSYHMYALSNELVSLGYATFLDNETFASWNVQGDLVGNLSAILDGVGDPSTFSLVAGAGDADNGKFQINGGRLEVGTFDFTGAGSTDGQQFFVRVRGDSDGAGGFEEREYVLTISKDDDNDSLPDDWEMMWAGNINDLSGLGGDFDNDFLTDLEEYEIGLGLDPTIPAYPGIDPTNDDTDGDTLLDGDEALFGAGSRPPTNPTNSDTDGDGLSDRVETNTFNFVDMDDTGTDPTLADSDGDCALDGIELAAGTDPFDPGATPPPSLAFSFVQVTDDSTAGIDAGRTYTHVISGGNAVTVNGVNFEVLSPAVTPTNLDWDTHGLNKNQVLNALNGWDPTAGGLTGPGLPDLFDSFTYSGNGAAPGSRQTFTLSGLTPGQSYEVRLYVRPWAVAGTRLSCLTFRNGTELVTPGFNIPEDDSASVLQNGNDNSAYYIAYQYTAQTTELSIEAMVPIVAAAANGSFHMYGMSNEVAATTGPSPIQITNVVRVPGTGLVLIFKGAPNTTYTVTKSGDLTTGSFGPLSIPLSAPTDVNGDGQVVIPESETTELEEFYRLEE